MAFKESVDFVEVYHEFTSVGLLIDVLLDLRYYGATIVANWLLVLKAHFGFVRDIHRV